MQLPTIYDKTGIPDELYWPGVTQLKFYQESVNIFNENRKKNAELGIMNLKNYL